MKKSRFLKILEPRRALNTIKIVLKSNIHEKNSFAEVSKNLAIIDTDLKIILLDLN